MASSKISSLTQKSTPELTDKIPIVDMTASPIETKYCTFANMLVAFRIKQGENGSQTITTAGYAVVFTAAIGTATDGSDYDLIIQCRNSIEGGERIEYEISDRTENGFTITPAADAYLEYTAILI